VYSEEFIHILVGFFNTSRRSALTVRSFARNLRSTFQASIAYRARMSLHRTAVVCSLVLSASASLARAAGFVQFGTWDVIASGD